MSTAPCRLPEYWIDDDNQHISQLHEGYFYRRIGPVGITHVPYDHLPYDIVKFELVTPLTVAQAALDQITGLDADWEALNSEAPNSRARDLALLVLDATQLMGMPDPSSVTASAEGGIGIVFRSETRYAAIECLNDGEIWVLYYDESGNPHSEPVDTTPEAIQATLREIAALNIDA